MAMRDAPVAHPTISQRHAQLVKAGRLTHDPGQAAVAAALDRLTAEIADYRLASKSSALGWLFARRRATAGKPKGLYIHGGVGRGKTLLMDMFFETVPVERKRRAHFNDFMADVHDRIQAQRAAFKTDGAKTTDPMPPVARAIAEEAWVLCFDEFSVTDIADAMILSRLFEALFARGVVLVATSNIVPEALYREGLNRGLFEPFIALLRRHVDVIELGGDTDHRLARLSRLPVYVTPLDAHAAARMDESWEALSDGLARPDRIVVKGRTVPVPAATASAARFSFAELCGAPLGARDYLAIADRYDTLVIDGIPRMDGSRRNEAKRFILLVDTLYDRGVRLIASAEDAPSRLYRDRDSTEAFEFARTASRLVEMQSQAWVEGNRADRRTAGGPAASGS